MLTTDDAFLEALRTMFIPGTAQVQRLFALRAYLPTVMPASNGDLPDEVALVFYESQDAYHEGTTFVLGRAYQTLHSTIFSFDRSAPDFLPRSKSDFPKPYFDELQIDTPHYLLDTRTDWQTGFSQIFVGRRAELDAVSTFTEYLRRWADDVSAHAPEGLDGLIVCRTDDYVIAWEHWSSKTAAIAGAVAQLAAVTAQVLFQPHEPTEIEGRLDRPYAGLSSIARERSMNIIFPRLAAQ